MATIASFFRFKLFFGIPNFARPQLRWEVQATEEDPDACRARMDFVKEMMQSCPEAFASELGAASAMLVMSRRS